MNKIISILIIMCSVIWAAPENAKTLDELIDIALKRNHNVSIAELQFKQTQAWEKASFSGFYPSVSMGVSKSLNEETIAYIEGVAFPIPTTSARLNISETIFDGARSWYSHKSTMNQIHSSKINLKSKNEMVIQSTKTSYYAYLASLELHEVAILSLELAESQLQLVSQQYELQAVSETDLLKAKVRKGQAESQVIQSIQGTQAALNNIRIAIGYSVGEPLAVLKGDVELNDLIEFADAKQKVFTGNSQLETARIQLEGSSIEWKTQLGVFFPTVYVAASYDASDTEIFDSITGLADAKPSTSLNLSIPIFSRMSNKARLDQLKYGVLTAKANKLQLEDQLLKELDDLLVTLKTYHQLIPINEEIILSAEMDSNLAQEKYNLGANDILDLLNAQVSLIQAKSELVRLKYSAKIAEAQLETILGTSYKL
mgnify:CR=1 FL=1